MGDRKQRKVTVHREEKASGVKADRINRKKFRAKVDQCIDPLDSKNLPPQVII